MFEYANKRKLICMGTIKANIISMEETETGPKTQAAMRLNNIQ